MLSSQLASARPVAIPMVVIRPLMSPPAISTSTARSLKEGRMATISVWARIMMMARAVWTL